MVGSLNAQIAMNVDKYQAPTAEALMDKTLHPKAHATLKRGAPVPLRRVVGLVAAIEEQRHQNNNAWQSRPGPVSVLQDSRV